MLLCLIDDREETPRERHDDEHVEEEEEPVRGDDRIHELVPHPEAARADDPAQDVGQDAHEEQQYEPGEETLFFF